MFAILLICSSGPLFYISIQYLSPSGSGLLVLRRFILPVVVESVVELLRHVLLELYNSTLLTVLLIFEVLLVLAGPRPVVQDLLIQFALLHLLDLLPVHWLLLFS